MYSYEYAPEVEIMYGMLPTRPLSKKLFLMFTLDILYIHRSFPFAMPETKAAARKKRLFRHSTKSNTGIPHRDLTRSSRETGCVSEMLNQLHLQLITRRTNRRLTILHKAIYGHLSLPANNLLQPIQCLSRHLNIKAFNTIHASKNCYKYSYFPQTIRDWNSLPDAIVNIPKPQHFKQALIHD